MENIWDKIIKGLSAAAGAIAGVFGGLDMGLKVMVILMICDYLSGIIVAWLGKSAKTDYGGLSSKIGARGIAKKGLMLLVVVVATQADLMLGTGAAISCRGAVIWFYIANEGLSLLENLALAGVPFPDKIKQLLGQLKDKNNDTPPDGDVE